MNDPRLQALLDQLDTILLVINRPIVQWQLLTFLVVFLLAWLIPLGIDRVLRIVAPKLPAGAKQAERSPRKRTWRTRLIRWLRAGEYMLLPVLGLVFSQLAIGFFESQGWRSGLLKQMVPIFWLVLIFRVASGLLQAFLEAEIAKYYQRRFVVPIFIILVLVSLSTVLAGTFAIGEIELISLLDTPLTFRSIATALILLYFFLAFAWIARELLQSVVLPRTHADPGVASTITLTSYYAIVAIGILTAVSILGFDLSSLAIIFGGLSVGIGFGLQELIANFISGIMLLFDQTLRPGDVVEVGGQRGTVSYLRMRATVLRTIDNIEVFVPNKTLLTSTVSTYTHTDRNIRRTVAVGVSYDSDPTQVRDILLRIAQSHGLVLDNPPPAVFFTAFGNSSLDFEVAVWIDEPSRNLAVLSDLRFMIFREFEKAGIEIPFPQSDLHVRSSAVPLGASPQPGETQIASNGVNTSLDPSSAGSQDTSPQESKQEIAKERPRLP